MSGSEPLIESISPQTHFDLIRAAQSFVSKVIEHEDIEDIITVSPVLDAFGNPTGESVPHYDLLPKVLAGWTGKFFTEPSHTYLLTAPVSRNDPEQVITLIGRLDVNEDVREVLEKNPKVLTFHSPVKKADIPLAESMPELRHNPSLIPVVESGQGVPSRGMSNLEGLNLIEDLIELTALQDQATS